MTHLPIMHDWMTNSFLLLNSNKAKVLLLGPKSAGNMVADFIRDVNGFLVQPKATVKGFGVMLDAGLSFQSSISKNSKTAFNT